MYNICIHLERCLGKIFDCIFLRKNRESLLETKQSSDILEHHLIYPDK
jgi:hypothetical protein